MIYANLTRKIYLELMNKAGFFKKKTELHKRIIANIIKHEINNYLHFSNNRQCHDKFIMDCILLNCITQIMKL